MLNRKTLFGTSALAIALTAAPGFAQSAADPATQQLPAPSQTTTSPGEAAVGSTAPTASAPGVAPETQGEASLGDIVVTAQRRSERLQDVPVSVTAVTSDDLLRIHSDNISRLEFITPGLTWGTQGSDSFPAIRGVRTSLVSAQNDPVIGFYVDGIYQSRTQQQSIPLFDVERVEVQRGPQGTLYGRNTFGGNISVVTGEPTKDFGFGLNGDLGNYSERRVDGYVNLPLSDTLQVRVAGVYQKHDGYVHSAMTPGVELDDNDENAERINVKWKPDSKLEVDVHAGHWQRSDAGAGSYGYKVAGTLIDTATGYQSINGSPVAVNPSVPNGSPNIGTQDAGLPVTPGAYTNDWNYQPYEHIRENYVSGQISYDLDFATLRSITGYTDFRANRSADNDQSSKTFAGFGYGSGIQEPHDHAKTFTEEVQLASNASMPLQWIVGGYYLHDNINEIYEQKILPASLNVGSYKELAILHTEALAAYAQAYYFVVPDKLRIIGGIRYSHERKAFHFNDWFSALQPGTYDFGTPDTDTSGAPKFNKVTWKAGAEFTPTRQTMFYATVSTGFESGGVNDTAGNDATPSSYAPQTVTAFEAGWKNQFLDNRVQTNFAVFYNRYNDLQINVYTPAVSYFGSAGKARSYGAEFAIQTLVFSGFHVDATAAYLNAKYTRYISGNNFFGLSNPAKPDPISVDLSGYTIPQSPKFKTTLQVYYDLDLNGSGTLQPFVEWLYSSKYYTTDFNTALDRQKSYSKIDASLRYTFPNGKWYIEGYGNNLTKEATLTSAVIGRRERIQVSYDAPRTYGVRAGIKF